MGDHLRKLMQETIDVVLRLTNQTKLLDTDKVVRRAVEARLPFCDTINVLQVLLLKTLREGECTDPILLDTLQVSIQGVVAGKDLERNIGI